LSPDTNVSWSAVPGADHYVVWWRDTTSPTWRHSKIVSGGATSVKLEKVVIDDWFFGVSAVSAAGYASPVVFAGLVGDFAVPEQPPAN
jgi:hypothetical protein